MEILLGGRVLASARLLRQHPIGGYIADCYCAELRLVLEIDGGYHDPQAQHARDADRTATLESLGLTVVRLRNSHVTEARLLALIQPHVPPLRRCGEGDRG